ncbi:MAG: polymer-forming cytoskeletal protein [Candidatus Carbobacillus altaicus]|nr:polymer-forming cytoskeletal protein [Candidatus Carbobacillus altaicus]
MWKKHSIKTEQSFRGYSVIQQGVWVKGNITAEGSFYIDGKIEGDLVTTQDVVIGKHGQILGTLRAGSLRLAGDIQGEARVEGRVHLSATARLTGTLLYASLSMEEGAYLEGTIRRLQDAKDGARSNEKRLAEPIKERIERTERLRERIRPQAEREEIETGEHQ